jgi:penicillin-binding protein 1C
MHRVVAVGGIVLLVLVGLRLAPKAGLGEDVPRSTAVLAAGGELLRLTLASDDQYRRWLPLERVSSRLTEAVMLYEDRWFRWHPGVNPWALARSALVTASGERRQGGSTITMQVARRLYRIDSRSVSGKLVQIAAALWIELRYGKNEILEAYLNLVPYGGNIEGVGAASIVLMQKDALVLTLPEILTLAVIPQNPRRRATRNETGSAEFLGDARRRLWQSWLQRHPEDALYAAEIALPVQLKSTAQLPFRAPHYVETVLREARGQRNRSEIRGSLNWPQQALVERLLRQYADRQRGIGIRNAAALLLDARTMQVKALVGSSDFNDESIDGQVNAAFAKRSPGSTLKPFIYALALDQGVLHPASMLKDAPTAFGPFSPENFDGRFVGPISAQDALIRSRNVPAVAVAARLSRPGLYDFLKSAGVAGLQSEKHYGLALTLGGGEVTMEELARMEAVLANGGVLRRVNWLAGGAEADGLRLFSEEAAYITLDMLRQNPRPDTELPAAPGVAWKTGTSWSFRDAWSVGVFGDYVLVVWIGNFDGSGNPAFVGVKAAAPLFFALIDGLRGQNLIGKETLPTPPSGLARIEICSASGDIPNEHCHDRKTTWFIPGKSPIRESTLHRALLIDTRNGQAVCSEGPHTRREVFEYWPSDMLRLFREAGIPRRQPPRLPDCIGQAYGDAGDAPRIVSPLRGVTYTLRLAKPTTIALKANATGSGAKIFWFDGSSLIGNVPSGETLAWNPASPGRHVLRAVDEQGRADIRDVIVEVIP